MTTETTTETTGTLGGLTVDISHACDSGFFSRVVCPEPCGAMHSYCTTCEARQDFCAIEDEGAGEGSDGSDGVDRDSFVPVSEHGVNLGALLFEVVADLVADHPMWTGPDGEPLDYSPEREARIGDFVDSVTETVLGRLRRTSGAG